MTEIEKLQQAIAALEAQRALLGEAVMETALAPLREKLAALQPAGGFAVQSEAVQPEAEAQLKIVTVLFTDVAGSTHLAQYLDPEDNMAIIDGALQRFKTLIEQHSGRVLRFTGDGLKAIFGAPIAQEDDAERAVRAGLALLEEAKVYARHVEVTWGLSGFNVRVGVNTGQVLLGGGVEAENTAIGMAINLAARMESTAPPGSLRISHDTYRHVRGVFDVQPQPPMILKGNDQPVQTYLVLRAKPRAFRATTRGVEGVETRMVGRQVELEQLQAAFEIAVQQSVTQIAVVVGEPGVGKSRLLYEFEHWIELHPQLVRFFRGRATYQMAAIPYSLLRDMFSFRFDILESDPALVVRQKLERGLGEFLDSESQMKAHFIGSLLGFDFRDSPHLRNVQNDPQQLRSRTLVYLAQFFSALTREVPAVIFLEDIHWADRASLDAVDQLIHDCSRARLLVVTLTRPVLFESYPDWCTRQKNSLAGYTRIFLTPLGLNDCRKLVAEILKKVDAIPETLRELIVTRSEGNPFYVEELIKVLIDDGVILKDEAAGAWQVDLDRLHELRVPPTLTAVLQARLDSLPAEEKVTLQQAAVVGRVFWDAVLKVLQAADSPPVPVLEALARRELVYPRLSSAFAGTGEYIFKHALLRDITYESVLKRARRVYHKQVAGWLVEATQASGRAEEYAAVIAEHFLLAEEKSSAADWYLRAGERARSQGASMEARRFYEKAMEFIPKTDQERRWQVVLARGEVLSILGDLQAWQANLDEMLELAQRIGDEDRLAQTYFRRAFYLATTGDDRQALKVYEMALQAARLLNDRKLVVTALGLMLISQTRLGELEQAAQLATEALTSALEIGDEIILSRTLTNVAVHFTEAGDFARAAHCLRQAVDNIQRLGDRFGEAIGLGNLGYIYVLLGLPEEGRLALQQSLEIADLVGARRVSAYSRINLGLAFWRSGELHAAQAALLQSIPEFEAIGDLFGQGSSLSYLALTLEQSGDAAGAELRFREARAILMRTGVQGYIHDALAGLARCAQAQGRMDAARRYIEELFAYLSEHGAKGMEFPVWAYLTCATVFERLGEQERGREALEAGYNELMGRAGKISDLEWRRSFLENVPEHRMLFEMRQQQAAG